MLEPQGPLPPEIYWRRRALAIGGAVALVVLVVIAVVSIGGGSDGSSTPAAATTALANPTPSRTTSTPVPGASGGSAVGGTDAGSAAGGSGAGGSGAGGSAAGGAAGTDAAAPGAPAAGAASGAPAAAVPPGQCSDQSLAVKVTSDQTTYAPGVEPSFTVVITNISSAQCSRDLGSGLQQVLVFTLDNRRLWSNVDCFPAAAPDVRTLAAGQQATFSVKWSGTTSEPGCTAARNPVAAGGYSVVGQLGEIRSAPETFNLS